MYSCRLESAYDLSAIADALPGSYPYLLDSATSGPLGQCSLLLRANGEQLSLATNGDLDGINERNVALINTPSGRLLAAGFCILAMS